MVREWLDSRRRLEDILGQPVRVGSIPGGAYSRLVAKAAAEASLEMLFTSEPTERIWLVGGCKVLGRYTIRANDYCDKAASLAQGKALTRAMEFTGWNAKKVLKRLARACRGRGAVS